MCRRQCMLTELKELTAWLNVKNLQQQQQQQQPQQQQPPRWLQHPFYNHNQIKLKHHRRILIPNDIKHSFVEYRRSAKKCVKRDIAARLLDKKDRFSIISVNDDVAYYFRNIIFSRRKHFPERNLIVCGLILFLLTFGNETVTAISLTLYSNSLAINIHTFPTKPTHIACNFFLISFLFFTICYSLIIHQKRRNLILYTVKKKH